MDTRRWMTDLYGGNSVAKLRDMTIPMTHDSATASLNSKTLMRSETGYDIKSKTTRAAFRFALMIPAVQNVLFGFAVTQHPVANGVSFLTAQLEIGARAFDLRLYCPSANFNDVRFQHGTAVWDVRLIATLLHMRDNFLRVKESASEVIILRMSHLAGSNSSDPVMISNLLTTIQSIFSNSLCYRDRYTDLSNFAQTEFRVLQVTPVIIIFDIPAIIRPSTRAQFKWLHLSNEVYDDDWSVVQANRVDMTPNTVLAYINAKKRAARSISTPNSKNKLLELQAHFQTGIPDPSDLIRLSNPINVRQNTLDLQLNNLILSELDKPRTRWPNIIAFDFLQPEHVLELEGT